MKPSAARVAGRIAWRNARKNMRRSFLVLIMVGLPVALVTAAATIARTAVANPQDEVARRMGGADLVPNSWRGRLDPQSLEDKLPPGSVVVTSESTGLNFVHEGELVYGSIIEPSVPLDSPVFAGFYELQSGRAPRVAGEAAVHETLLARYGAAVGETLELRGTELVVTGVVRVPQDLELAVALVGQGTLAPRPNQHGTVLIDLPESASVAAVQRSLQPGVDALSRSDVAASVSAAAAEWEAVSFIGGVLALFATGLVAAAGFVVGARRQLRELGLVGAVGGEPRHVRAVVLLGGTTVGFVGSVMGTVVGLLLSFAIHPKLDELAGRVVGPVEINWLVVAGAIAMGTAAATLAAFVPARAAARLSTTEALAGRTAPPRPPGRVAAFGLLVLAGGGALTAWSTLTDRNALLAAGLIGMLLGVLLAIPLLVTFVGRAASALPTTGRIAARNAARHGRATGAAVAAAVIALAIPIAVATYSLSEETYERRSPRIGEDQLLIGALKNPVPGEAEAVVADLKQGFSEALVVPLSPAVSPGRGANSVFAFGVTDDPDPRNGTVYGWDLFIADSDVLRALHAESGIDELADGKALVLGGFRPVRGSVRIEGRSRIPAVAIDSPAYFNESMPKIVISSSLARRLGLDYRTSQHLLTADHPLSSEEIARAREIVADHSGFFVNAADDFLPEYALARSAATAASLPLGLAILAVAVALVASESRRTHQVLVAIGAGPLTHRKIAGATSGVLATIAAVLAVPGGLLPTIVVQVASQAGRPVVIPWPTIAIVVLVTPLLSAAVAGLIARSPKLGSLLTPAT